MKGAESWRPTKFVQVRSGWRGSRDRAEVARGARFVCDLVARVYQSAIERYASGRLLDLGCGNVPLYGMYRDRVEDIVCVDWPRSLHTRSHLDHEFDLNSELPIEGESFDTLLLTDVLEHIARPEILWPEIARILRPGGKLILTVPFLYWIHEGPDDHFRYTEHRLRKYCLEQNLQVVELEPYGGSPEILVDMIAKHLAFSAVLSAVHLFLGRFFVYSRMGRKFSRITAAKFPLGYCLIARKMEPGS